MEGVSCNKLEGALYLFPRLHLPSAAIRAAESKGVSPDTFYAHRLLDATGIAVVPGSGFHQVSQAPLGSSLAFKFCVCMHREPFVLVMLKVVTYCTFNDLIKL